MRCENCDQMIPDTAKVCGYCGHRQPIQKQNEILDNEIEKATALITVYFREEEQVGQTPQYNETETKEDFPPAAEKPLGNELGKRKKSKLLGWAVLVFVIIAILFGISKLAGVILDRSMREFLAAPTEIDKSKESIWGVRFYADDPIGKYFWDVGTHKYKFKSEKVNEGCLMEEFESDPITFQVSFFETLYPDKAYLRIYGIFTGSYNEEVISAIHPEQVTMPVITFWNDSEGYTREMAEKIANDCAVFISLDNGNWRPLETAVVFVLPGSE